jgi:transcriptional regulator with XRE-family HTH domain
MEASRKQSVNPKMLKLLRERTGMTQKELAEYLGVARPDISKIERGLKTPDWLVRFALLAEKMDQAKITWEDAIMELPDFSPRVAEKGGDYNA